MEWVEKCWGRTRCLTDTPWYQRHELFVEQGFCSIHYHQNRANRFHVESGVIEVHEFFWKRTQVIRLSADMTFDVPSLVVHQFRVIQYGRIFEEYYPDRGGQIRTDDIIRLHEGSSS